MRTTVRRGKSVVDLDGANRVAMAVAMAMSARRIYGPAHQRATTTVRELASTLECYFTMEGQRQSLKLTSEVDHLAVEGIPLKMNGPLLHLTAALEQRNVRAMELGQDTDTASFNGLLMWLTARATTVPPTDLKGISFEEDDGGEKGRDQEKDPNDPAVRFPEFRMPLRIYRTTAEALDGTMEDVRAGRNLDLEGIMDVSFCIADEIAEIGTQALGPAQLVKQDLYTYQHSVNVALITTALLQPFEPNRDRLAAAAQAALLHDIGKCRLPGHILMKKGKLTDEERTEMQRHPEYGADILLDHKGIAPATIEAAYCHHMRDDGHGYPQPRTNLRPGPITELIQIADMFEAITAPRPYKAGRSAPDALRTILKTEGIASRRSAIATLAHRLTQSPPGSQVVLNTGERATVVEARPEDPDRPRVKVVTDKKGDWLDAPKVIDLAEQAHARTTVEKVLLKPAFLCF